MQWCEVKTRLDSISRVVFYDAADSDLEELRAGLESIGGLQLLQISGSQFTDAEMRHVSRLTGFRYYFAGLSLFDSAEPCSFTVRSLLHPANQP
jgi:hypothetical protein